MGKSTPKNDSGLFGNLFDLNGDGKTDAGEAAFMLMMFDEMQQEEERKKNARSVKETVIDLDDMDIPGI